MLPSFRLIAAAFLCGFVAVFAGLRLATSLHAFHAALPVTSAHAATLSNHGAAAAHPMRYDLRFVASTAVIAPPPVNLAPGVIESSMPAEWPLTVEDFTTDVAVTPTAAQPNRAAAAPVVAVHHGAAVEPRSEMPPDMSASPAIDAQPTPSEPEPAIAAIGPSSAPEAVESTGHPAGNAAAAPSEAVDTAAPLPTASASSGGTGPDDEPLTPAAAAIAAPQPQAAKPAPRARPKSSRNNRRPRNARRAAAQDRFGSFGSPSGNDHSPR